MVEWWEGEGGLDSALGKAPAKKGTSTNAVLLAGAIIPSRSMWEVEPPQAGSSHCVEVTYKVHST